MVWPAERPWKTGGGNDKAEHNYGQKYWHVQNLAFSYLFNQKKTLSIPAYISIPAYLTLPKYVLCTTITKIPFPDVVKW